MKEIFWYIYFYKTEGKAPPCAVGYFLIQQRSIHLEVFYHKILKIGTHLTDLLYASP